MAKIEIVTLSDSLDERIKTGVETVTFFDPNTGEKREIELGEANRKHFANHLDKLTKYIEASVVVEAPKPVKTATAKSDLTIIREWARKNGYTIGDRGRIKAEILAAFDAAHMPTAIEGDKVVISTAPVVESVPNELDSALENSANGNVESLGDFTQYADDDVDSEPVEWTDAEIMNMMSEIEAETGKPASLSELQAKAKSNIPF